MSIVFIKETAGLEPKLIFYSVLSPIGLSGNIVHRNVLHCVNNLIIERLTTILLLFYSLLILKSWFVSTV